MAPYRAQQKHAPIDESVQLPAAIRAAAAKSQALHDQQYKPEVKPEQKQEAPNGKTEEPKVPAAEETQKVAEPETKEPAANEDWENNYRSMKGRNDRNERLLHEQTQELANLRAQLEQLQRQPVQEQKRTNENTFKKITDEERSTFGEDFIDVAQRAAAEKFEPVIESLKSQIEALGGKVETVARTTHDNQTVSMNQFLDQKLPNWKQINRDKNFLAWVGLRDPYSGAIRMDMMRAAHAEGNAQRVLAFFQGFLSDEAATDPQNTKLDVPAAPGPGKVKLEDLAAPGRAKASASDGPSSDPDDKETITRAQVQQFYRLKNSGHYRGNEAEADKLEARIFKAQAEGRIK